MADQSTEDFGIFVKMAEKLTEPVLRELAEREEPASSVIEGGWLCGGCGRSWPMDAAHCDCLAAAIRARIAPGLHGKVEIDAPEVDPRRAITLPAPPDPSAGNPLELVEGGEAHTVCRAWVEEKAPRRFVCTMLVTDNGHRLAEEQVEWMMDGRVIISPKTDRLHKRNAENAMESLRQSLGISLNEWKLSSIRLPSGNVVQAEPVE